MTTASIVIVTVTASLFLVSLVGLIALLLLTPRTNESRLDSLSSAAGRSSGAGRSHQSADSFRGSSRSHPSRSRVSLSSKSQASGQMANRLVQAGLYRRNSLGFYFVVKSSFAIVPVAIGLIAAFLDWVPFAYGILGGAIAGILGTLLPSFWLDSHKKSRQTSISRALPDALDVIVVCLEAGLSFRAAVARVAKELRTAHPLLSAELLIAEREIQLGCSGGEAFKHFADRFDMETLRSLASVIMQAERFGASISNALRVHAEGLRVKRFQMAEEKAQKASIKLLFPTMFLIFPTLYVVLLGPAVIEMISFFSTFGG